MPTTTDMQPLVSEQLLADPRVAQARKLLHEALADASKQLNGPKPADPARAAAYGETLDTFAAHRGGKLWYPYLGSGAGNGCLVELADGSVKYDFISGIGVHFFGHSHPMLLDASLDAALCDIVMQGVLQQNVDSTEFTARMIALANASGAKLNHCFMTTSGAMANENSFKLAFQKANTDKGMAADRMLAFAGTFCGRTLALSSMSDKPGNRVGLPTCLAVDYVPFFDEQDPEGSTRLAIARLKELLTRYPRKFAGFKFELVQGEGGFFPGSHEFFLALIELCKNEGVAVIADEIQTFCRLSRPFAFQHYQLDEYVDLVNVGKSTQVCCTLFTDEYAPKPGLIAQTFTGSTASIKAGIHILDTLAKGDLYGDTGKIAKLTGRFRDRLKAMADKMPGVVSGPYGLGAMIAFTPFDGSPDAAKAVLTDLYDHGVIAFLAGRSTNRVRFLPPIPAITENEIDAVCDILEASLKRVAASRKH
jgi:acetylornithine aminotransferase